MTDLVDNKPEKITPYSYGKLHLNIKGSWPNVCIRTSGTAGKIKTRIQQKAQIGFVKN